jgi:chemotaxis protein CheX
MELDSYANELEQVVDTVFTTMMGIEVVVRHGAGDCPERPHVVTASIRLLGNYRGTIRMHCLPAQACEFAGSFLGMPAPDTVDDDVRDVLGELANMIAGNLKCTLGPGVTISIPAVKEGEEGLTAGHAVVYRSGFETPKGPFWMTVLPVAD